MPVGKGKYVEKDEAFEGKPTFYYGSRELLEFSIVNIPSNPEALQRKFEDELVEEIKDNAASSATDVPDKAAEVKVKLKKVREMETKKVLPGTLKACYEERNKVNAELKAWSERLAEGKETMDQDGQDKLSVMLDDQSALTKQIEILEQLQKRQFEQIEKEEEKKEVKKVTIDVDKVFEKWLRRGFNGMTQEEIGILQQRAVTDPQSTTTTAGGYLIPTAFNAAIEKAMLPFASVLEAATRLVTGEGNSLLWPTVNDTSNKGHLLTESTQDTVYNVTFGQLELKSYMFTSYIVKVPLQLLQDSAVNIEALLADLLGERLGRILSDYFTTGTGSSQPQGIVYGATDAALSSVGATAITRDNILDLKHSVNVVYRNAPGAAFMFNDNTFKAIAKLTFGTSDDRPLWQPSIVTGQPDLIEGKKYFINDSMADIGASENSMIFGDLKKLMIRQVLGTTLFTYREKYMDYLQIGFQAYNRWDSKIIDAGTHPIKKLTHSAT